MSGLFTRRAIGVNGKWPIPGVVAKLGDTLVIHANNKLDEPTSLHSHGIFQNGTNYYDGAAMITECGIPPGGSFTYRIPLLQSGTYWIHSHFKAQTTDGLRTSLVIRDPNEHYEYDHEMILTFEDWYKEHAHTIIKQLSDPDPYARYKLIIPYGLINGECISTKNITFAPGKTYRLRLLNIGASLEFHFQIDHHDMHLIEIDGVPIKERVTRGVTLAAGQRASVLVTAKESTSSNYLFHADMYTDLFRLPKYNPYNFTGVVEYAQGAKVKREINPGWHTVDDIDLHPLDNEPLMEPTVSLTMDAYSGVFDDKTYRHSFDNITYVEPHVPSLLTALTTGDMAKRKEVYGRMSNAHIVKYHDVVQITIRNHDYYTHPFHLHGHVFQIVEKGSIRKKDHELKVTALGAPVKRDTFILRGG
ncbi:ferroxidase fet3, partial [Dipsacomyces acuminosporus]